MSHGVPWGIMEGAVWQLRGSHGPPWGIQEDLKEPCVTQWGPHEAVASIEAPLCGNP